MHLSAEMVGMLISYISSVTALCLFYVLFAEISDRKALRAVFFLLLFPTSFYLTAVYTEGLFFLLSVAVFYAASKKRWFAAGIIGGIASATRPYGILLLPAMLVEYAASTKRKTMRDYGSLLLIPAGLVFYMVYLNRVIGDPFAFIHALPAFGTGRETGFILLPQVMWRYIKIFMTVNPTDYVYAIALLEFFVLVLFTVLLVQAFKSGMKTSYILYSLCILLVPTVTGTLTSLPRYVLSAFPLFFVLASTDNRYVRILISLVFGAGLIVFTSAFLRGHFVA
jgi:Gpi18-like mannosyltransferase